MRRDSVADADWVRGLCRAWEVPLETGVSRSALETEAQARSARYEFLHAAAERACADVLVTAHHADDQAETVLFRLLRGTGLGGLAGIPPRRGIVVRPLLSFTRARIEGYAARARLSYREDPTNIDVRYARNRIRHVVLPQMEAIAPGFRRSLLRLSRDATAAERAWRSITNRVLEHVTIAHDEHSIQLARNELLGYHRQIIARVIRAAAAQLGSAPGHAGTRAALSFITSGSSGGAVELAGGVRLERHFERFLIRRPIAGPVEQPLVLAEPGTGRGVAVIGGRRYQVHWSVGTGTGSGATATFHSSALRFPLELRAWRPGDRIQLAAGTKKLKKLFLEKRVPRHERLGLPVLAEPGGNILWIPGLARATRAEPKPGSPVFQIRVSDGDSG
jgi:tRNA(Ile)-lysidine synthase